ncbi:MAG: hypothetical protein M1829_004094 [Trizodia sp. TS-e1964]|nr:MAG: hypothetical protein M1829_004094 [Trizodia sp. TS-e1964]
MSNNANVIPPDYLTILAYEYAHSSDNRTAEVVVVSAILLGLAYMAVGLRLLARHIRKARIGLDDYGVILSLKIICTTMIAVGIFDGAHFGLGKHSVRIGLDNFEKYLPLGYAFEVLYVVNITTTRFAVLLLYRRLFIARSFRIALYTISIFVLAWGITFFFLILLQCVPIPSIYTQEDGYCLDRAKIFLPSAGIGIAIDFAILILPMPTVWKLEIPRREKFALMGIFLLGGFVCIASIVRVPFLADAVGSIDPTWNTLDGTLWSVIEICIGIVCACLPLLRPIFYNNFTASLSTRGLWRASPNRSAELAPPAPNGLPPAPSSGSSATAIKPIPEAKAPESSVAHAAGAPEEVGVGREAVGEKGGEEGPRGDDIV